MLIEQVVRPDERSLCPFHISETLSEGSQIEPRTSELRVALALPVEGIANCKLILSRSLLITPCDFERLPEVVARQNKMGIQLECPLEVSDRLGQITCALLQVPEIVIDSGKARIVVECRPVSVLGEFEISNALGQIADFIQASA